MARIAKVRSLTRYTVDGNGCWLWTGPIKPQGYGAAWDGERVISAHTLFWEDKFGPVPEGKELHHDCKVKLCVNPNHLVPTTRSDHLLREPSVPGVRTNELVQQVKYLRDNCKLSFAAIGSELEIGTTTAHRAYHNLHGRDARSNND